MRGGTDPEFTDVAVEGVVLESDSDSDNEVIFKPGWKLNCFLFLFFVFFCFFLVLSVTSDLMAQRKLPDKVTIVTVVSLVTVWLEAQYCQ